MDPPERDSAIKAVQHATKLVKGSGQIKKNDAAATSALDGTIGDVSRRVLAWTEGAAATAASGGKYQAFPSVLLSSCCRYMEALATAFPDRFAAECRKMARPVASCILLMTSEEAHTKKDGDGDGGGDGDGARGGATKPPVPPAAGASSGSSPALAETGGDCCANGIGAAPPSSASGNVNALAAEKRKILELWFDMLGICLLPFCSGSGSGSGRTDGTSTREQPNTVNAAGTEQADDGAHPFDSDNDSDDEHGGDDGDGGGGSSGGKARLGWVGGWMRRAGVALAEPVECPFEIHSGGRDEDLPCRLAALAASHAKAAAAASRPASVSSPATVLAVLVTFTDSSAAATAATGAATVAGAVTEGQNIVPSKGHEAVVEEAFSCLAALSEAAPESSAQAECVKVALVALKECAQAARLACLEPLVPGLLLMLEGVPSRLKLLLTRSKSQGPKACATARSFCREALAAAVACARKLIGRAGAAMVAEDPRWFLEKFVVKMASPLLLGDAVGALRAAASSPAAATTAVRTFSQGGGGHNVEAGEVLRDVVLPGAVERLKKALGNLDRYSAAAAKEVLKATAWLVQASGADMLVPQRHGLGITIVECAANEGRSSGGGGGGGLERDEKLRLCLKTVRRLVAGAGAGAGAAGTILVAAALGGGNLETDASSATGGRSFAEAALDFACGVVEREWLGKRREVGEVESQNGEGDAEESIITLVEAHVTLVAILRSPGMRVPGVGEDGEWPPPAKRLAKLAWAVAYRVRKMAGAVEASMALADDDVMLLCQGLEVLEALDERSGEFFEGYEELLFFEGDLLPVLTTLRSCHDKNSMHPVVFDACSWVVRSRR